jgi:SAM-dependent methyltransferase
MNSLLSARSSEDKDLVFAALQRKWSEVPTGEGRIRSEELLKLDGDELKSLWLRLRNEATEGKAFPVRGWYHTLYRDVLRGKRVLDVGSGLGIDGITFAQNGAYVHFLDIVRPNLKVVERICGLLGVENVEFTFIEGIDSLARLSGDFDAIWCQGSLINVPFEMAARESGLLLQHLPIGGRWIELAYPKERWDREGQLPFEQWGVRTDGPGTPWVEWYDLEKVTRRLASANFEVVLHFNFHHDDFNWFDLVRKA